MDRSSQQKPSRDSIDAIMGREDQSLDHDVELANSRRNAAGGNAEFKVSDNDLEKNCRRPL